MTVSRILVTGGASGIGAAIARHWANLGHDVTITDVNDEAGRDLASSLGCTYVRLDVRNEEAWRDFASGHETFDVVFLNAGVSTGDLVFGNPDTSPFTSFDLAAYRRTLGVNVDGVVFGVAHLAPAMVARGSGDIIVTASMASLYPIPPDPIYGLSKHAVSGFVKSLAPALVERGVYLSAICPFFVDTPLVPKRAAGPDPRDRIRHPHRRPRRRGGTNGRRRTPGGCALGDLPGSADCASPRPDIGLRRTGQRSRAIKLLVSQRRPPIASTSE